MTKDDWFGTLGHAVVVAPAVTGLVGLTRGWNVYTCISLILGSFVLLVTYEIAKG